MPVPLHLVAGYLGAGKTSTLGHLLRALPGSERVAVVVNDFGQAAVDEATFASGGVRLAEIRGACICCTAPEGFVGAVAQLLDAGGLDRLFVEPTGIARPADLIDTVRRAPWRDRVELRPLLVVVDPHQLAGPTGAALRAQAAVADVVVANRTDLAAPAEMEAFEAWVSGLWPPPAAVHRVTHGRVPTHVLDPLPRAPRGPIHLDAHQDHDHDHDHPHHDHHDHDHPHHDHAAVGYVWGPEVVFARRRLHRVVSRLEAGEAGPLARLKGLFRTEEGTERIEVAGGHRHLAPSDHRRDSRVDIIVTGATPPEVGSWFEGALLTEEERARAAHRVEVALADGTTTVLVRDGLLALPDGVADVSALVPSRTGAAARVRAVLDRAGAPRVGAEVVVVAADGYTTPPVPIESLEQAILVHSVDGGPLPAAQGGPFRLLIPGDAGPGKACANVKGVVRIAVRPRT